MQPSKLPVQLSNYIPMQFPVNITTGQNIGDEGRGQVALNDRPFLVQFITHQIKIPALPGPQEASLQLWQVQDGMYTLDWSLYEQSRFWKGTPPIADSGFGSVRTGEWIALPAPVSCAGNETLHVTIRNLVLRPANFAVQVIFHGIQELGSITQTKPMG